MPVILRDIPILRGDNSYLDFGVAGLTFPLASCAIRFTAKHSRLDPDVDAVITKSLGDGIVTTSLTAGTVTLLPADTESIVPPTNLIESQDSWIGFLYYDIQLTTPFDEVFTVIQGRLLIAIDVTQTIP